jgi:ZIP family zinc transporter
MLEAFGWGLLAQSSLLVAGLLVCWVTVPTKVVGVLGGFGAGAMIAAVSFDLLPEGQVHIEPWQTGVWMLVGVAVFLVADQLVERRFGSQGAGGAMGIVVGSVVDGVPESAILGIQVGIGMTISLGFVPRCSSRISPRQLRPRLIWRPADGARDGSASSGCSWSWPAASLPPSGSWPPT